ncbi:MAG: hypothetical protein AAFP78_08145, partial [Pseudomonadota bacterium]
MLDLKRDDILGPAPLPDATEIMARGRARASGVKVGSCAFLEHHGLNSEAEFKRRAAETGDVAIHAQIGYRDPAKTRRAWREIWEEAGTRGARVDRYGVCLDWCMGYARADRDKGLRGTGLILESEEQFAALAAEAPVAPHFGDFVMGFPAAVENTVAALKAGSTAIGNLGQYFAFRLPGHDDDVGDTAATLEALSLCAAQPVEVLIHSNLDDGFAALFTDLACTLGAVLIERHIVEDLIGGTVAHCYGHSFSEPQKRLAFQAALARVAPGPGSMVYGNTVAYQGDGPENYAALAAYLSVDIAGQRRAGTGHAVTPIPITEAARIPDIDETVDVIAFAGRLAERLEEAPALFDFASAEATADELVAGAETFKSRVLKGLDETGIDTRNPLEMLLALRRIGAKRLEEAFGPGAEDPTDRRGRRPILLASTIAALEASAEATVAAISENDRAAIERTNLVLCVSASDVHEYGKILLTETLDRLGVGARDAGIHAEPARVAELARGADAVAISTYNGVALDYLRRVRAALDEAGVDVPILIGGKINQVPEGSNTSLPVDVSSELTEEGAVVCRSIDDLGPQLA